MDLICIVIPVYNDWTSFSKLVQELDHVCNSFSMKARIIAIDDGSTDDIDAVIGSGKLSNAVKEIELVRLVCNMGHQRAISIGLAVAAEYMDAKCIIVMDSDGEDRPVDIRSLISASEQFPGNVICARRTKRSETAWFRVGYWMYRRLFRFLTGEEMDFGNFCLIPCGVLPKITHSFDTWNHLPGSLLRSRLPLRKIAVSRGTRYAGRSSMNPTTLVVHGLSAISVFIDRVMVRLLAILSGLVAITCISIAIVLFVRFGTDLAIPGWTTTVFGFIGVFLLQLILISVISVLSLLNNRSSTKVIPATDAIRYIVERKFVLG